jgi:hypothetical protein
VVVGDDDAGRVDNKAGAQALHAVWVAIMWRPILVAVAIIVVAAAPLITTLVAPSPLAAITAVLAVHKVFKKLLKGGAWRKIRHLLVAIDGGRDGLGRAYVHHRR